MVHRTHLLKALCLCGAAVLLLCMPAAAEEQTDNPAIQFGEDEELEYPEYTASDYITIRNYEEIEPPAEEPVEVTENKIHEELYLLAGRTGALEIKEWYDSDEAASIMSGQRFQTMAELKEWMKKMVARKVEYTARAGLLQQYLGELYANAEITGYPEDALRYKELGRNDRVKKRASEFGVDVDRIDDPDILKNLEESAEEEILTELTEEMFLRYIAEQEGISAGEDDIRELYEILTDCYGYDMDTLTQDYTPEKLKTEALRIAILRHIYG